MKNTLDTGCQVAEPKDGRAFEQTDTVFPLDSMEAIPNGAVLFSSVPSGTPFQFRAPYLPYGRGVNSYYIKEDSEKIKYAGTTLAMKMSGDYPVWPLKKESKTVSFRDVKVLQHFTLKGASHMGTCVKTSPTTYRSGSGNNITCTDQATERAIALDTFDSIPDGTINFAAAPVGSHFYFHAGYCPAGLKSAETYIKKGVETFESRKGGITYLMDPMQPIQLKQAKPATFGDLPRFARFEVADASTKVPFRKITDTCYILDGLNGEPNVYVMEATKPVVLKGDSSSGQIIV
jgi:hypothetical protein